MIYERIANDARIFALYDGENRIDVTAADTIDDAWRDFAFEHLKPGADFPASWRVVDITIEWERENTTLLSKIPSRFEIIPDHVFLPADSGWMPPSADEIRSFLYQQGAYHTDGPQIGKIRHSWIASILGAGKNGYRQIQNYLTGDSVIPYPVWYTLVTELKRRNHQN